MLLAIFSLETVLLEAEEIKPNKDSSHFQSLSTDEHSSSQQRAYMQ